jgi:hypothetical protein
VYGRKQITRRKRHDLHAAIDEERVGTDNKGGRNFLILTLPMFVQLCEPSDTKNDNRMPVDLDQTWWAKGDAGNHALPISTVSSHYQP